MFGLGLIEFSLDRYINCLVQFMHLLSFYIDTISKKIYVLKNMVALNLTDIKTLLFDIKLI